MKVKTEAGCDVRFNSGKKGMVQGLPVVDQVEQVCDSCTLGKQHLKPYPQQSSFRANQLHADLCGKIKSPTPSGKQYFLLVVDDHNNRYMRMELLRTKDEALARTVQEDQATSSIRTCEETISIHE